MRSLCGVFALLVLLSSCKQEENSKGNLNPDPISDEIVLVAEGIIYDVIVKAEIDDPWENEKVAGYKGEAMIEGLFNSIYEGKLSVTDYFTEEKLSAREVKKMEAMPEFSRERIGKIQFTEDWYYNSSTMQIEKKLRSVVLGYRKDPDDLGRIGYLAGFKIEF